MLSPIARLPFLAAAALGAALAAGAGAPAAPETIGPHPTGSNAASPARPGVRPAQSPPATRTDADAVAAYGGRVHAAVAADGALHLAQGYRIETSDLADPVEPRRVASLAYTDTVAALAFADGRLVATVGARLVVLDRTDPLRPRPLGELALSGRGIDLAVDGARRVVYALYGGPGEPESGVDIVSLNDPAAPRRVGGIAALDGPTDLVDGEGALYVASWRGLHVYDTRDPSAPVLVPQTSADPPPPDILRLGRIGAVLYAVHHLRGRGITMTSAIELPDPLTARERGGSGTNAYEPRHLLVHDGWLLKTRISLDRLSSSLDVLGGSQGRYDLGWEAHAPLYGHVTALAVHGDHVYAATDGCGLTVLGWRPADFPPNDVAELPVEGSVPLGGPIGAVLTIDGDAIAVGSPGDACNRVDRIDMSDPTAPALRALAPLPGWPEPVASSALGAALTVYDARSRSVGLHLWPGPAGDESLSGPIPGCGGPHSLAFDAHTGAVMAVGAAPGSEDGVLMALGLGETACGPATALGMDQVAALAADGSRVAVLGTPSGTDAGALWLFDGGRVQRGSLPFPLEGDQRYAATFSGRALYIAGAGLQVIDVSDLGAPRVAQQMEREPSYGKAAIDVQGAHVVVAERDVVLYDASDPLRLREALRWDVGGAEDVALLGGHVLVAADTAGMLVLPMLPPGWRAADQAYLPAAHAGP